MSYLRTLSLTLLSAAASFCLVSAQGCGTGAVGVSECRNIEQARCVAAKPCGLIDDVDACERFYRDHCLHGLAVKPPVDAVVQTCISVIEAAGKCAEVDPETPLAECKKPVTARVNGLKTTCDVVAHPELATECSFLLDTPPVETGGAGGEAGSDAGGAAGTTGAAGTGATGAVATGGTAGDTSTGGLFP
jgi:hypothetical protein